MQICFCLYHQITVFTLLRFALPSALADGSRDLKEVALATLRTIGNVAKAV